MSPLMDPPPPFGTWLRATWLGWLLGVPAIALLALLAEALGVGGAQVFVGAGMGLGVGALQAWELRWEDRLAWPWLLTSSLGLALPFLVYDVTRRAGWLLPYQLGAYVALGGVVVGAGQAWLLRARLETPLRWLAASLVGWGVAGGLAHLADVMVKRAGLAGLAGAGLYLLLTCLPGGVLGGVTGAVFRGARRSGR